MPFPPGFLDEIRTRLPLSEVASKRIKLSRAGREHKGCCPFHNEKTPSFYINDGKGFFHCFGCGAHGDVIGFVMRHDRLSFPEAIEQLAQQAGLEVPRLTREEVEAEDSRKTLHQLCEATCVWFEQQLHTSRGKPALDYLVGRGLSEAAMTRFRLGYAPQDGSLLISHLKTLGFEPGQMMEVGLARQPEDGRAPYSFFRDRVMFPVTDRRGRVVAFGGRIMSGDGPKYINSPDHPLFHKGKLLYSLARAREEAPRGQPIVVVEGYMDVIAMVEGGFTAAVAPLGTAITEEQIEQLWKLGSSAGDPIICLDGDSAGQKAAARAIDRVLPRLGPARSVRFAFLPDGCDPDELIGQKGRAAMQQVLDQAIPLIDMLWKVETVGKDFSTPESRAGLKANLLSRIEAIADQDVRGFYKSEILKRVSEKYSWSKPKSKPAGNWTQRQGGFGLSTATLRRPVDKGALRQRLLLLAVLRHPGIFERLGERLVEAPIRGALDNAWQAVVTTLENSPELESGGLVRRLSDLGHGGMVDEVLNDRSFRLGWLKSDAAEDEVVKAVSSILAECEHDRLQVEKQRLGMEYRPNTSDDVRARITALRTQGEAVRAMLGRDDDEGMG